MLSLPCSYFLNHFAIWLWYDAFLQKSQPAYWAVCGSQRDCSDDPSIEKISEKHGVRCCSDFSIRNWRKQPGCNVWGQSIINAACYPKIDFVGAAKVCASNGARLCTKKELQGDCAEGSGCDLNKALIWSSTTADNIRTANSKRWAICGRQNFCSEDPTVAENTELHEIRCCSDTKIKDWLRKNGCNVWSESYFEGSCHREKDYEWAVTLCSINKARLCTKEELEGNCAADTGCELNNDLIWSSTSRDDYPSSIPTVLELDTSRPTVQDTSSPTMQTTVSTHWVLCGKSGCPESSAIVEDFSLHEVRCCSDEAIFGWRKHDGCSVWTEAVLDRVCYVEKTFEMASAICSNYGGRLCTKNELEADCAADTGCEMNRDLIWSSSPGRATLSTGPSTSSSLHWAMCGREGRCREEPTVAKSTELYEVRCCVDDEIDSWELQDGCNVWSAWKLNGVCYSEKNYMSAETICASNGARLCTKEELKANCVANTGCGQSDDLIWSSTVGSTMISPSRAPAIFPSIAYNSLKHCHPERMGDKWCDGGWYLTSGCEYDKGDCDDCEFEDTSPIGDGTCNTKYNSWQCGFDGGDCQIRNVTIGLPVTSLSFSMDSKYMAIAGSKAGTGIIKVLEAWEEVFVYSGGWNVSTVIFSHDSRYLAMSSDTVIKLWRSQNWAAATTFSGHTDSVNSIAFSLDGTFIASGSMDKSIKIWNVTSNEIVQTLTGHNSSISSISFGPTSLLDPWGVIASASYDGEIKIWNVKKGKCIRSWKEEDKVNSLVFSPNGDFVVTGSCDTTVKFWRVSSKVLENTLSGHTDCVTSVNYSPDGNFIASTSLDGSIKVRPTGGARAVYEIRTKTEPSGGLLSAAFTWDGKFLASGSVNGDVRLWRP